MSDSLRALVAADEAMMREILAALQAINAAPMYADNRETELHTRVRDVLRFIGRLHERLNHE